MLTKKGILYLIILTIVIVSLYHIMLRGLVRFSNGYYLDQNSIHDRIKSINDEKMNFAHIASYSNNDKYILGIRYPAISYLCNNKSGKKYLDEVLVNKKQYFIFDTLKHKVFVTTSKAKFTTKKNALQIKIEEIPNRLSNSDLSRLNFQEGETHKECSILKNKSSLKIIEIND